MRLYVDTNIFVDFLSYRTPFYEAARMLFLLGSLGELDLRMGAQQATDIVYILTTGPSRMTSGEAKEALRLLRPYVDICSLDALDVDAALDSGWDDFEDACIYQCALKMKADAIVTRNQDDFARSSIKVFDCIELLDYLEREKGLVYEEIPW